MSRWPRTTVRTSGCPMAVIRWSFQTPGARPVLPSDRCARRRAASATGAPPPRRMSSEDTPAAAAPCAPTTASVPASAPAPPRRSTPRPRPSCVRGAPGCCPRSGRRRRGVRRAPPQAPAPRAGGRQLATTAVRVSTACTPPAPPPWGGRIQAATRRHLMVILELGHDLPRGWLEPTPWSSGIAPADIMAAAPTHLASRRARSALEARSSAIAARPAIGCNPTGSS
mmetsp:Transcript_94907/g.306906  ORF Transcript_94907/g.306906 Transcript_94907/m.306906 type:complete len:226 (+) Transcript_94907:376-1053(+)